MLVWPIQTLFSDILMNLMFEVAILLLYKLHFININVIKVANRNPLQKVIG